jgi:phage baseplate assembly protein W
MALKFLGAPYPIIKTPRGLLAQSNGVDQIKADLLQLLLTTPGERVMTPLFGTPLKKLIFEQNDATLELQAREMVVNAVATWEPRIIVENIRVTSSETFDRTKLNKSDNLEQAGHILGIEIEFFDPENISEIQSLVLELPLAGGANTQTGAGTGLPIEVQFGAGGGVTL